MPENAYEPVRDASISGVNTSTNYGSATSVQLGVAYLGGAKSEFYRAVLDFGVSDLAGEAIVSARLERFVFDIAGEPGATGQICRSTRPGDWIETQVTWLQYKNGSNWTTPGGDLSLVDPPALAYGEAQSVGWHTVTGLGAFVEDALEDRGGIVSLFLRLEDEAPDNSAEYTFYSRQSATNRPRLVVEYGAPAAGSSGRREQHAPPSQGERRPAREERPATGAPAAQPAQERRRA